MLFRSPPTEMATASGQVTNAVFGFTSMMIKVLAEQKPSRIVVAFDRPEPTFRHDRLDSYKATRSAAPDILRQQMGLVRKVLDVLGIPVVEAVGYEADDIVATLAAFVTFVPIIIVLTLRYLAGGHSVVVGTVNINIALMTGMDYLAVITPWLASLGYNGWLEKKPVAPTV